MRPKKPKQLDSERDKLRLMTRRGFVKSKQHTLDSKTY